MSRSGRSPRSQRPANVAYYARNREAEIARVRRRQAATLTFLRDLRRVPCADCGAVLEPHQMDFDDRDPAAKKFQLTDGRAMLMSRQRLSAEIAKCDVVCANCHRMRTWAAHRKRLGEAKSHSRASGIEARRRRWRLHGQVLNELRAVPCVDCGTRYPPCAMDFDHLDGSKKTGAVTQMVGRAGLGRILAEAAKCDIVCASCHRARTYRRRGAIPERE